MTRRRRSVALVAALVATASAPITAGLVWQESEPDAAPVAAPGIRFNFKDAPFAQVLDFFARASGLPVIYEAEVPKGTITFISAEDYSFGDALTILNLNLQPHDRRLRREGKFLYLATLTDAARKPTRVPDVNDVDSMPLDEFVTVTIPLDNALAETVAEQVRPLVGPHGSVTAVPQQNMLIVVESAPQCARIRQIVESVDAVRPIDSDFELFPLKHAQAEVVVNALKGLVGQKIQRIIIDKDGKQKVVEEVDVGGVSIQPDVRTNSVVVVGPRARIDTVRELVNLLDVPEGAGGERSMRTFALSAVTADDAASQLDRLFAGIPENRRPTVLALGEAGKVTVVAQATLLTQAAALLSEIDPGGADAANTREARAVRLEHADPPRTLDLAQRLLTARQRQALATAPSPDGRGIIVAGPKPDVDAFADFVRTLDTDPEQPRDVRVVRLSGPDPEALLARAAEIHAMRTADLPELGDGVTTSFDASTGSVLVTGSSEGVRLFAQALDEARQLIPPQRTTRLIDVTQAEAADIVGPLRELLASADPIDPSREIPEPTIHVVERTNSLMVTAEEAQHRLITDLVHRLDTIEQTDLPPLRLLQLRTADATAIAQMLGDQYRKRPQAERAAKAVEVRADAATNTLIVSAHPDLFDEIKTFVDDLNTDSADGPERVTVLFQLKSARAEAVAEAMDRLYAEPPVPLDRRGRPMPWAREAKEVTVSADPSSNSLIIDAPSDRIESLQELAAKLDRVELPPVAELRTYRIIGADLDAVSRTLMALARQGNLSAPAEPGKQAVQVVIETEPRSGTLIVAGDETTFERVEAMLEDLSAVPVEKQLRVVPIINADAENIRERAIELYAQQIAQIPGANPVEVSIDRSANSLLIVADAEGMGRFTRVLEELQRQAGPERDVRLVELRFAKAADVIAFLEDLVQSNRSMTQRGGPEPTFEAIEATNSLLISAQSWQFPIIDQLIARVDNEQGVETAPLRILRLRSTDAANLAGVLQRTYDRRPVSERATQPVDIQSDTATNTLIVSAHPDVLPEIEQIVGELNETQGLDAEGREIRIFPLRVARAEELAETIDAMFPEPPMPIDPRTRRPRPDLQQPKEVVVRADRATNSLIVDAPAMRLAGFEQIVESLDRTKSAGDVELRTYRLTRADANSVRDTLTNLARTGALYGSGGAQAAVATPVTVDVEAGTKTLIVSGPTEVFEAVERVIENVDEEDSRLVIELRAFRLEHASASGAAESIEALLLDRSAWPTELADADLPEPRITVNAPAGEVLVSAPHALMPLVNELIETLDKPVESERLVAVIPMVNADAQALMESIGAVYAAGDAGEPPVVRVDPSSNALIVRATPEQMRSIRELAGDLDAAAQMNTRQVRMVPLDRSKVDAALMAQTIRRLLEQQGGVRVEVIDAADLLKDDEPLSPPTGMAPMTMPEAFVRLALAQVTEAEAETEPESAVTIAVDPISNALIVVGSERLGERVAELAKELADQLPAEPTAVRIVALPDGSDARAITQIAQQTIRQVGRATPTNPGGFTGNVVVAPDPTGSAVIVWANDTDFESVGTLIASVSKLHAVTSLTVKVYPLTNVRADRAARAIGDLFADQPRGRQARRIRGLDLTVQGDGLPPLTAQLDASLVRVTADPGGTALIVAAPGESIPLIDRFVGLIDQSPVTDRLAIRRYELSHAAAAQLQGTLQRLFDAQRQGPNVNDLPRAMFVADARTNSLLVTASAEQHEEVARLIVSADVDDPGVRIETIQLEHAQADRAADALRRFFTERARAEGLNASSVSIVGSADGNVVLVSGPPEHVTMLRELAAQIDQPEMGENRRVEVFSLKNAQAWETNWMIQQMFPSRRPDERVISTPQPSVNALIVSAPEDVFEEIAKAVAMMDAAPTAETANMVSVALDSARAQEVAQALQSALPQSVKVKITPVARSNSLLLTGSDEAIALVMDQIQTLDTEPVRTLSVFRRVELGHAMAGELSFSLRQMLRDRQRAAGEPAPNIDYTTTGNALLISAGADEMSEILSMIEQLDIAADAERTSQFVKLRFAKAEQAASALDVFYGRFAPEASTPGARSVTVVPDPSSNSLVISAPESEWEGINALLARLDSEEYDTSQQLVVIPLRHADAAAVAKALNDGFRAPLDQQLRREQIRIEQERRDRGNRYQDYVPPPVLVDATGTPTVSPELQTNSLVIFAARDDLERIRRIVDQLDVPDYVRIAESRVIPLEMGKASSVAASIRELYADDRRTGSRAVVIAGDDESNALIVRAGDEDYAQIRALAESLQREGDRTRVRAHVVRLSRVPATRLRETVLATFTPQAKRLGESLSVEVDRQNNALVIAASQRLFEEIERTVRELDAPPPDEGDAGPLGLGQSVRVVEVTNNDPARIRQQLEQLGVMRDPPADRPGLVAEAVNVVVMSSRRALTVTGGSADVALVAELIASLDAAPADKEQQVAVAPLKMADAGPLVATLESMLRPDPESGRTGPARALTEQLRRLRLSPEGIDGEDLELDLSTPIRLIADEQSNAVVIVSSAGNVRALKDVIGLFDTLPVGDAVVVRMFPLENAAASRIKGIIDQLFSQGEELRRLPGTRRQGLPTTTTGQALAGEIAVSIDERTNTLIVAGREEAVALVEVLVNDLDGESAQAWVEPRIIRLKFADAVTLAKTLGNVLVQDTADTPEAEALRRQAGRIRALREGLEGDVRLVSDLFAPMSGLVIEPEEQLNALIVVGSPRNIAVVNELVGMLDIEAASAANTVRVFPLEHASAERVSSIVDDLFRQRADAGALRDEDRLVISPDVRTNALIVSTSTRSFTVLESLLGTLDSSESNYSVGLHVIAVPEADAQQLAPRIQRLMRDRIEASTRAGSVTTPADAFSVEADPSGKVLIVAASDENLVIVKELVDALTGDATARAGAETTDVVPVTAASAEEAAEAINELYVRKENERRGSGAVRVVANPRLNALVVSGTADDVETIRGLVGRLDETRSAAVQDMRRIELKTANAIEVVNLLQNVLSGRSVGRSGPQATRLRFFREKLAGELGAEPTEADFDALVRGQVTITPELRTNSVVVVAPPAVLALVEDIIDDLDTTRAGERRIATYRLENADARAMAEVLRDLFNMTRQGDRFVLIPTAMTGDEDQNDEGMLGGTLTPVPDQRRELSITIDARTNTLLVSGTEEYLDLVQEVVLELDQIQATEREQLVYRLKNARAVEVEDTLTRYFEGEAQRIRQTLGPQQAESLTRRLEQEVTVVGDEKSNTLVISASPRYMDTVSQIVDELDAAPPQVMIQVLLAEVTLDGADTWGMDVKVGPVGGQNVIAGTFGAGAALSTALGVANLSVEASDFSLLVRSLEVQGKLEVLSRPQVTVKNNETAMIQVGEDIAIVTGVERLDNGNTRSDVERRDTGIILNVTPTISSDGFVQIDLSPEISTVSSRTTQISEDFEAPIINKRVVDTTVTVRDGQTIVIGGLIQTQEETRETKVPILGDIPILGILFRSKDENNIKTELLVILTPTVIPGAEPDASALAKELTDKAIGELTDLENLKSLMGGQADEEGRQEMGPPAPRDDGDNPEPGKWMMRERDAKEVGSS